MKKIASVLLVSMVGGAISLGAYKAFFEKPEAVVETTHPTTNYIPTNFVSNNTNTRSLEGLDFTVAAEKTVNAVVHVKNTTTGKSPTSIADLFYGGGGERTRVGTGSGVIFSPDGFIITNNHVIDNAESIEVTMNNNRTYTAELVGSDAKTDIALLKINADEKLPYITFGDSDATKIGEWVLAVGNPFNLTSTVTAGIISAKARDLNEFDRNNQSFIQTDAAVNPGNSGGALVNTNGELVGINTAITSQTGSFVGYSFAVPSNIARKVIEDIIEYGDVQRGLLGISALNRYSKYAVENGLSEIEGVYVSDVQEDSGAEKAGLREGDIIKRLDNVKVSKFSDLSGYLSAKRPGDVVNVTVDRDDRLRTLPVTLSKTTRVQLLNMELKNITKDDKKRFDIKGGAKVTANQNDQLRRLGLEQGIIITQINETTIQNIEDIERVKSSGNDLEKIVYINAYGETERLIFK